MDIEQYMVTRFVNAVRDCLKAGGFAKKEDEKEEKAEYSEPDTFDPR